MEKRMEVKTAISRAFLITSFALLSAVLVSFVPTENSPDNFAWYLLTGVTLFLIVEHMLYEKILASRVDWRVFTLSHFVAYSILGIVSVSQIGYINLRLFLILLGSYTVIMFELLRNFQAKTTAN
jgi:hypothetical protein